MAIDPVVRRLSYDILVGKLYPMLGVLHDVSAQLLALGYINRARFRRLQKMAEALRQLVRHPPAGEDEMRKIPPVFRHLTEDDPAKVAESREIYERASELLKSQQPRYYAEMQAKKVFLMFIYGEHLTMIDAAIEKYSEQADYVWRSGFVHPGCGPVVALGFRLHDGVDGAAYMLRKIGA